MQAPSKVYYVKASLNHNAMHNFTFKNKKEIPLQKHLLTSSFSAHKMNPSEYAKSISNEASCLLSCLNDGTLSYQDVLLQHRQMRPRLCDFLLPADVRKQRAYYVEMYKLTLSMYYKQHILHNKDY